MTRAIDFYIEKIEGFEEMDFEQRRYWVEYECLEKAKKHTKATLKGLFRVKPKKEAIAVDYYKNEYKQYIDLYYFAQCEPMKALSSKKRSEAQKDATKKMIKSNHEKTERYQAIAMCQDMINSDDVVVLDTETTSLDGVAIQLAVIDLKTKKTLLNTYIKNSEPIEEGAFNVHGISEDMLVDAPSQKEALLLLEPIIKDKHIVAFNSGFDATVCRKTFKQEKFGKGWICAMYEMAVPVLGSTNKYGTISLSNACYFAGVSLENAHDAEGDARGTVDLIYAIAAKMKDYE